MTAALEMDVMWIKSLKQNHWSYLAVTLSILKKKHSLSERQMSNLFEMSKSQIHRLLMISRLSPEMRQAARDYGIEINALLLYFKLASVSPCKKLFHGILDGDIKTYNQAKRFIPVGQTLKKNSF